MAGLYIAADLGSLGAAAAHVATAGSAGPTHGAIPSFGHAGADAAAATFHRAAAAHGNRIADASSRGAAVLRGYVIAFHEIDAR